MALMVSGSQPNTGSQTCQWWIFLKDLPEKAKNKVVDVAGKANKLGRDEPRRIIHCLKVGLAITLVSLLYYVQPLYKIFGESGVWAVLTVVLVSEFTVGKLHVFHRKRYLYENLIKGFPGYCF